MSQVNMLPKEIQIPLHVDTSELDVALEKVSQLVEKAKEAEKIIVDIESKTQNQSDVLRRYAKKLSELTKSPTWVTAENVGLGEIPERSILSEEESLHTIKIAMLKKVILMMLRVILSITIAILVVLITIHT